MARRGKTTRGSQYIATAALTDLLDLVHNPEEEPEFDSRRVAEFLVRRTWDVEHFPVAGKVQITLDLASLDKAADDPQAE